ncbi:MAG: hypothetical protein EZS28_024653 [Streblomastix strix]|uniref:Uncharacterized protein n=1 Tax=Streblomastix strix TaxID=222440 RepID=A0A5J4VBC9_9EUKA|nr:MAG: hypothetical protein EZS28_024653 [Streblomastix strix]
MATPLQTLFGEWPEESLQIVDGNHSIKVKLLSMIYALLNCQSGTIGNHIYGMRIAQVVKDNINQLMVQLKLNRKERDRTESNSNISGMETESSKCNGQNEIEKAIASPTRPIQYEKMDKDMNGDNYVAINKISQETKLRANIPAQLIQISPQMTMTTDAAPSGWGSILEKEPEMIAIAHGTWNIRQAKLINNSRDINAITQGLRSFAKSLMNSRVKSLGIRRDNRTAVFDIRKWKASTQFNKGNQTGTLNNRKVRNLDPDYSLPRSQKRNGENFMKITKSRKLQIKGENFQQTCLQMNLNPTIDLFSQHFNNLLSRFMSTVRGHGEIATFAVRHASSEEVLRRTNKNYDNTSTMARPDMVHRTGKRECIILYA